MFGDALLESAVRRTAVLGRIHYLIAGLTGTFFFVLATRVLPLLLPLAERRALVTTAGLVGAAAALYTLMLGYVWTDARRQRLRAWPWLAFVLLLNLPGFLLYLVRSAQKSGDWRRASLPLAYVAESVMVGMLILMPLIYTQALPRQYLTLGLYVPTPPPGPPPAQTRTQATPLAHPCPAVNPLEAPPVIPTGVRIITERPEPPRGDGPEVGVIGGDPNALPGGRGDAVINTLLTQNPPPPPPPPPVVRAPRPQERIRVGSGVIAAQLIYQPKPAYPPLAIMAHVQGTVVLQAVLSTAGTVEDLKVISGHPLLVGAALDAVKTWRYQPTLLNGEPVEVLTEIDVNFKLGE